MIHTIPLGGMWHFYADEEKHYTGFLPEGRLFTDTVTLPGTTATNGKGRSNEKREDGCLTEVHPYSGQAWFRRTVHIPKAMRGRRLELFLERTRITRLWVNGAYIGTQDSLVAPHIYDLSAWSSSAELMLHICVDNTGYPTRGGHMTSVDTQTNWNGITGEMSLRFYDDNCIRRVRVETDAAARRVTLRLYTEGDIHMLKAEGEWTSLNGKVADIAPQVLTAEPAEDGSRTVTVQLDKAAPLWDEYTPVVGHLTLRPFGSKDVTEVTFGLADLRADGHCFTSHGRPVMLRGKHDGMAFPLTGAAPTDVESWLRVMNIAKSYGIDHYRFHTCCPPDAAFTAADLLGIFMEPEICFWGSLHAPGEEGFDAAEQTFLIEEGRRMLETFGHHPSFCLFSLGNELWGSKERMGEVLRYYRQFEHRILFTQGSNNFQFWPSILPEDDFFVGVRLGEGKLLRGSYGSCDKPLGHVQSERPSTMHCYDPIIRPAVPADAADGGAQEIEIQYGTGVKKVRIDSAAGGLVPTKPVVTHEIGQYVTYPNFDEIPKYTGVLQARNFEIFRERLTAAGMADRARDFFLCSGKLAVQCYKEELEAAMRSELIAGFQILDIQDFPGQGTATVGILDAFMDSKGLIEPETWRGFCSDSVILGMFPSYCITDRFEMQVKLRHHAPTPVRETLHYTIHRGHTVAAKGTIDVRVDGQGLFDLGKIAFDLKPASSVHRIDVELSLSHTSNRYRLWQYPAQEMPSLESGDTVCVTSDLVEAKAKLAEGGRVLFLPGRLANSVEGFYCADFWCYPMFRSISESMGRDVPVGTLGLCIDHKHPAVRGTRCERWSTPQWYDAVTHADLAILDGTNVTPIVQMIDNFERNHKLGLLFACKVGRGSLLVCTARLMEAADRPEIRQLAACLMHYAASPDFIPTASLTEADLDRILAPRKEEPNAVR